MRDDGEGGEHRGGEGCPARRLVRRRRGRRRRRSPKGRRRRRCVGRALHRCRLFSSTSSRWSSSARRCPRARTRREIGRGMHWRESVETQERVFGGLLSRSRDRIVWREIYFFHFPSSNEFVFFRFSQKRILLAFRLGACKASTRRQSSIDGRRPAPSDDGGDAGTSETRREEEEHPVASTPFVLLRRPSTPPPFSKMESFAAYFLPDFHLGAHAASGAEHSLTH